MVTSEESHGYDMCGNDTSVVTDSPTHDHTSVVTDSNHHWCCNHTCAETRWQHMSHMMPIGHKM
jgi:hypothetical protein